MLVTSDNAWLVLSEKFEKYVEYYFGIFKNVITIKCSGKKLFRFNISLKL